ncbi:hypothetical protein G7043_40315 [Lentzea sp. NEAU-D13]|uniref:Uncharacterized protein n=1 Tax=Lentzea alba TaxID=2714351 RepID=A0A7C9RX99_9PSEU|nr:hypothetical protein [Lentzea alba]NGY65168.1 hypothetical protein [Lentzea alba]
MPTKRLSFDEYGSSTAEDEFTEEAEPSYDSYYVVLPETVWKSEVDSSPVEVEDSADEDDDYKPPRREPMSTAKAGSIGGISAALVAGAIPAVVVDLLPAALAGGLAAGLFGGLMGRSLGIELQQRRARRREAEREF